MLKLLTTATLALLVSLPASAQTTAPDVADTSFREAHGDRVLQLSATIPAAPSVVWAALTTAQGWRRLGVQSAAVDYRVGGVIETLYKMFAAGNGYTLETLQKSFAGGGSPP